MGLHAADSRSKETKTEKKTINNSVDDTKKADKEADTKKKNKADAAEKKEHSVSPN